MSHQCRPHPGHQQAPQHHTPARQYLSGDDLRQEARDSGVENDSGSDWYPGPDIYQPVAPNPIDAVAQYEPPDALIARKPIAPSLASDKPITRREANIIAIEMIMGPFELDGSSEYTAPEDVYELPAHTSQAHSPLPKPQVSRQVKSRCPQRSLLEFQKEFRYLKGLITSGGAAQPPTTQSPGEEEDITYLRRYIIRGTTTPSSLSPLLYSSPSPPPSAPPTPSLTPPCPYSQATCTALSTAMPTPHTSPHTYISTLSTAIITATSSPLDSPAKPHAYRPQPSKSYTFTTDSNTKAATQAPESPPPLPPKPFAYQAMNYEARIRSIYGSDEEEVYYRRSWGDGYGLSRDEGGDEDVDGDEAKDEENRDESMTLRATNPNPPR